jgi:hypothetical protein
MNEICDKVQRAQIFSKIDLKLGYNLIRIKEGDEWKSGFCIRYGYYTYRIMLFRIGNTTTIFQNMMNKIMQDLNDQGVIVYINNILIYSVELEKY